MKAITFRTRSWGIVAPLVVAAALASPSGHAQVASALTATPTHIDFGTLRSGLTSIREATVYNPTSQTVFVGSLFVDGGVFSSRHDCPQNLAPQGTCKVRIYFRTLPSPTPSSFTGGLFQNDAPPRGPLLTVAGVAGESLISHFYQALLGRSADNEGFCSAPK